MRHALVVLCLVPLPAFAGDLVHVELIPKAQIHQGSPAIVVYAHADVATVSLSVVRGLDGKRLEARAQKLAASSEHRFPLDLPNPARSRFTGTLKIRAASGDVGELPIDVEVELLAPLQVQVAEEDFDLPRKALRVRTDRPVKKVLVSVLSDEGIPLGNTEADVQGTAPEVTWKQREGSPFQISVTAWDEDGYFGSTELFPWSIQIPHEELNFESGSATILVAEGQKLETSFGLIEDAIRKYGEFAKPSLFIAGHTDTVGDAAFNRGLSERRARAIGAWFRRRGIKIQVRCTGFGEERLMVLTPDETEEVRNRRAEYIVAIDAPKVEGARWSSLP